MTGTTALPSREPHTKGKVEDPIRHTGKHQWRKTKATTTTKPRERRGGEKIAERTSSAEKARRKPERAQ